jgi:hypothetical protein
MLPRDRDRQAARERLRRQRDHARAADRLMPLAEFYCQRPGMAMLPPGPPRCPDGCPHWWGRAGMSAKPLRRSAVRPALTPTPRRREVENPEFAAFIRRILRAYARRAGAGDLDALGHLADAVAVLRHEPWSYSWREIADALGVTRQTAHEKYRKASGVRRSGGQPGNLR